MRNAVLRYSRLVQGVDVRLLTLSALFFLMPHGRAFSGWWNQGWRFRFGIEVQAAGYPRYDRHAEQNVNFTQLLSSLGYSVALDDRSIRVIEVNDAGTVVDSAVVFQFDKDPAYNASTNASGTLVFLMKGVTGATATRHFHVYFETTGGSFNAPSFPARVSVEPNDWDEDQGSVRVDAWGATYYYHKLGGGLSSMDDRNGIDWIDYHSYGGSAGDNRGIPNAVYPEGHFHPGKNTSTTTVVSNGPLKVTLASATNDGKWECRWEFYPRYATFTMTKADHPYWFLYEGVPNGLLEPGHDYVYRSTQQQNFLWDRWSADVPAHEWVYFGDVKRKRSLFIAHHEDDTILDSYWTLEDAMTVFGFGRSSIEGEPVAGLIPTVPNRFTIGFIEDTTFARVADSLSSAYKPLTVTAGSAEQSSPLAPSLVAPASGATGLDIPLTLVWSSVPNANSYRLQMAFDAAFTSLALEDSTLTDTTRVVTGLSGKTVYYWRVRAKNAGGSGDWSLTRQFQTGLGVPLLLSPAQGSTGQPVPIALRWSVVKDATSYAFQVAHDALFTAVIIDQATMDTSASAAGLEGVTTYYWRVRALEGGSPGGYSSVWAFTTSVAAPVLVSPANDAGNIPLTVQLRWNRVSGAASYRLQVATDPGFATGLLVNTTGIGDTVYNLSGLSQSSRYYWRAGADGPGGPGPFSGTWSFSTSLPVPVLLAPGNSATAQPLTITFRWARVAGASAYRLQLATDAGFTTFIKNDSTITDTTRLVSGLQNSTQYFWRVSARNGSATSPFSGTWDFRTTGLLPGPVAQLSPADGAVLASDTALCTWAGDPLATRYWFEIAVDSLFQLRTVDSNGAQTSTVVRSLLQNQWYYWKVRGGNTDGWGPFSGVRKFKRLATSVSIPEGLPAEYLLEQNYPNPFNPSTTIRYALPAADEVRLEVFGLTGDRVALLVDGAQPAGYHQAVFDASGLASGTYIYRLLVAGRLLARTMVILK